MAVAFGLNSVVRVAYSDASDTGYGSYIVELGPQLAAQGVWSADLTKESSTLREILAVRKVLQFFAPQLAGLCVKWHTDNQNVAGCLVCKAKLSVFFLRCAFIMAFLLSLHGYPDPVMSKQII